MPCLRPSMLAGCEPTAITAFGVRASLMRRLAALMALTMLAACAAKQSTQRENINLSGFPQAFKDGYADGCASVRGPMKRDSARFKSDPQYARGWRDGSDICRRRQP